ncbi:hypothetical protein CEXT_144101 [Caerostris extrusa]|uniref:Uncharacterized protein n=1 Tax=Caerostris extrusa TaxID=172846 RepID=A0AAV4NXD1_CAEEX|nr:hypothetical protein CEXT_144101 [Caerostris extrusa]
MYCIDALSGKIHLYYWQARLALVTYNNNNDLIMTYFLIRSHNGPDAWVERGSYQKNKSYSAEITVALFGDGEGNQGIVCGASHAEFLFKRKNEHDRKPE